MKFAHVRACEHFTFAKQIFHREAISLARKGKFRWATCFTVGRPKDRFFFIDLLLRGEDATLFQNCREAANEKSPFLLYADG